MRQRIAADAVPPQRRRATHHHGFDMIYARPEVRNTGLVLPL
jgi:hypothetical protein